MPKGTMRVDSCPLVEVWRLVIPPSAIIHLLLYSRERFVPDVHLTLPIDDKNGNSQQVVCFIIVPSALSFEIKSELIDFAEQLDIDLELGSGSRE